MQTETPLVGIVMGSDSDWPVMSAAAEALAAARETTWLARCPAAGDDSGWLVTWPASSNAA